MRQLDQLDALFLHMETTNTPGHIGGLGVIEPLSAGAGDKPGCAPVAFEALRDVILERLPLCPRFGWKLLEMPFSLDQPYWVEDERYEPAAHIVRVALPSPGGAQELADLVGLLYARPLDRDRPLWQIFVIEGLQGGRVALLWKIHHCLMDGVSGAGLAGLIFDLRPDPAPRAQDGARHEASPGGPGGWLSIAAHGLRNAAARPKARRRHLRRAVRSLWQSGHIDEHEDLKRAPVTPTPRVSFNGKVGPRRSLAWSSVSLDELKRAKNALGVTLNDVVLALSGGAVRRMLEANGELPDDTLYASMPVSLRATHDATLGNQIREVSVPWGTQLEDPIARVRFVHAGTLRAKRGVARESPDLIGALAEAAPPPLTRLMVRLAALAPERVPLPANAVVSNVPSSPVPLYIAGARVAQVLPLSLLAPTQGLNVTVVSYCGEVHFGFTVDPDLVPKPWQLADAIPKALVELQQALATRLQSR